VVHLRFLRGHRQLLAGIIGGEVPQSFPAHPRSGRRSSAGNGPASQRESRPALAQLTSTQHHAPPSSRSIRLPLAPIRPNGPHARMATRARHQLPLLGASAISRRMGHGLGGEVILPIRRGATSVRADPADKPVASAPHVLARKAHRPPHKCPTFPHPHIPPPSSPQSRNLRPNHCREGPSTSPSRTSQESHWAAYVMEASFRKYPIPDVRQASCLHYIRRYVIVAGMKHMHSL
jgi:hypothetical protein